MELPCVSTYNIWLDEIDLTENVLLLMDDAICVSIQMFLM